MQVCCFLILSLQISLLYLKLLDLFTFDGEMQHICSVLFFSRTQRRTDPRGNWGSREQYRETFSQARERGNFWNVQIQCICRASCKHVAFFGDGLLCGGIQNLKSKWIHMRKECLDSDFIRVTTLRVCSLCFP